MRKSSPRFCAVKHVWHQWYLLDLFVKYVLPLRMRPEHGLQ